MKTALASLFVLLAAGSWVQGVSALQFVTAVSLPGVRGRLDHLAIDERGRRLFVAALGNDSVEVIDLRARRRLRSLSGCSQPQGVEFLPTANRVVVANGGAGTVNLYDGTTYRLLRRLDHLPDADDVRYDPTERSVYVGYGDGGLAVIDPAAGRCVARILLAAHAESFQVERPAGRIFVNVPGADQVAVIDRRRRVVASTWPMRRFRANFPMALDERDHRLLIGCRRPPRLVVLDTRDGNEVTDLLIHGDADDLWYDTARKWIYVSCGEGFLDVIGQHENGHYRLVESLPTAPGARTSLFSAPRDEFYLAVPRREGQPAEVRIFRVGHTALREE